MINDTHALTFLAPLTTVAWNLSEVFGLSRGNGLGKQGADGDREKVGLCRLPLRAVEDQKLALCGLLWVAAGGRL